ncbi:hypothetical protein D1164_21875 [Mariniphaga sediminis]|uniref:Outer membrane protein beta-barrel domain-containing protein n=1 Tax=Mariniphaga sediminis TaxID=1628158 RepID=A0A399CUL8_9BACT|nr:hypothetical protein [Mariniphaga sediminis]RIH63003.1 hypothetical protein D1164_21875 [Mariniphaga sediminis]
MTQRTFLLITLLFFLNGLNSVFAQDKIITSAGDTINCNILRVSNKKITYEKNVGGVKTTLQKERRFVKSWIKNEADPFPGGLDAEIYESARPHDSKWKISVNGGIGYRIAGTKEAKQDLIKKGFSEQKVDSYFKSIKWGEKAAGQVHYMLTPNYGLGLDYQFFTSSGSITDILDPQDGAMLYYGLAEDKEFTNYAGLSFYYHEWLTPAKTKFYCQVSLGLTMFRNESTFFYNPILITGKALGGNSELGYEYFITRNTALGIHLNFFQATITKVNLDDGTHSQEIKLEKGEQRGLARIDVSAGIKIYL